MGCRATGPARGRADLEPARGGVRAAPHAGSSARVHREERAVGRRARRAAQVRARAGLLLWPGALALGLVTEAAAYSWDQPGLWVPDLAVGLTFIACGLLARQRRHGAGSLLAATGVTWFLGTYSTDLLYLHRGPLVHLLIAYPGARPRSRIDGVAIAAGYVAALATPI